jgi:hypothetical protein
MAACGNDVSASVPESGSTVTVQDRYQRGLVDWFQEMTVEARFL